MTEPERPNPDALLAAIQKDYSDPPLQNLFSNGKLPSID